MPPGPLSDESAECRRRAEACEQQAREAATPQERGFYQTLAAGWRRLADEADSFGAR